VPVGLQGLLYVLDAALGVGAAIRGPDDVQFALRGRLADEVVHVGEGGFVVLALAFFALGAGGLREFVRGVRVYGRVVVLHASLHPCSCSAIAARFSAAGSRSSVEWGWGVAVGARASRSAAFRPGATSASAWAAASRRNAASLTPRWSAFRTASSASRSRAFSASRAVTRSRQPSRAGE